MQIECQRETDIYFSAITSLPAHNAVYLAHWWIIGFYSAAGHFFGLYLNRTRNRTDDDARMQHRRGEWESFSFTRSSVAVSHVQ